MNRKDRRAGKTPAMRRVSGLRTQKEIAVVAAEMEESLNAWLGTLSQPRTRTNAAILGSILVQHGLLHLKDTGLVPEAIAEALADHLSRENPPPFLLFPEGHVTGAFVPDVEDEAKEPSPKDPTNLGDGLGERGGRA